MPVQRDSHRDAVLGHLGQVKEEEDSVRSLLSLTIFEDDGDSPACAAFCSGGTIQRSGIASNLQLFGTRQRNVCVSQ